MRQQADIDTAAGLKLWITDERNFVSAGVGTGRPGEEYRRSIGRGSDTDKHPAALVAADDEPVDAEIVSESDQQTYAHPDDAR